MKQRLILWRVLLKLDKCLIRFFKEKEKETSLNNKRDENEDITTDTINNK